MGTLQAKISELEGKITDLEEDKKSFEEQVKLKQSEITEKDAEISSLQSKIQELETSLASFAPPKPPAVAKEEGGVKPSGIKSQIPWKSGTGIFVCPDCGSNRTKDVQDKSTILYIAAGRPIYAKKKRCLDCGVEWSVD